VALDERLRHELERAARPADPSGVYEHMIRRKERRRIARKLQSGVLAVAVVTGSIAGAYGLSRVFRVGFPPPEPVAPGGTSVVPSPSLTESPLPDGAEDIGLGFPVCLAERLGRIDYLGDGTDGNAWTAVPLTDDGTCPEYPAPGGFLLAVDHTGDRFADSWIDLAFECENLCAPFDATDLDGNGTEELIVARYFSFVRTRTAPFGSSRS